MGKITLLLTSVLWFTCNGAPSSPTKGDASVPVTQQDASVDMMEVSSTTPDAGVEMPAMPTSMDASVDMMEVSSPTMDGSVEMAEVFPPLPDPCLTQPAPTFPLKIMPAGDSITFSTDGNGGYRGPLFNDMLGAKALSVGTRNSATAGGGPGYHAGYSGIHTTLYASNLQGYIDGSVIAAGMPGKPDIILMMLGTNGDHEGAEYVRVLVRPALDNNPNLKILVAAIPDSPAVGLVNTMRFAALMKPAIESLPEYGTRVFYVGDTEFLTPDEFDPDMLHPNPKGYLRLANAWYAALSHVVCLKN